VRYQRGNIRGASSMWMAVVQEAGHLARAVRKGEYQNVALSLPRCLGWYMAFCCKVQLSVAPLVWHFFPAACPTCWNDSCQCMAGKTNEADVKSPQRLSALRKRKLRDPNFRCPISLNDFVEMFAHIYGRHPGSRTFDSIFLHFTEEIGEVAEHIRGAKARARAGQPVHQTAYLMASELADVFSWICNLFNRLATDVVQYSEILNQMSLLRRETPRTMSLPTLQELFWFQFRDGCPFCRVPVCTGNCAVWAAAAVPQF
jgi:NTP pyrophosphatase (non-canonical NTP hydrolase)